MVLAILPVSAKGFVHGVVVNVDGESYYLDGPPDGPDGATDILRHYGVQSGPNRWVGKHYNTGSFGSPQWWSSDVPDGEMLYIVHGVIDTWSEEESGVLRCPGICALP